MRIEVWFNNGLFRAYPFVNKFSMEKTDTTLVFEFGPLEKHEAYINLNNVNFIEYMPEED